MDSGETNKILAGILGAVLAFLLLGFFSDLIYFGAGGHEEEDRTLAFAVEVDESGGGGEKEEAIDYGALLAAADPSSGASVFNKCKACHNLDGTNAVGPHLDGVVGRDIASVEGFAYSDALMSKEGSWDLEKLFHFIHNPSGWAPGTKMGFAGLPDNQDKVDLITYLNEQGDSPIELVAPEMPESAEAEGGGAAEEGAEGEASAEGGGHAELIAAADPEAGANVFKKCQACHHVDGTNAVGPHLDGVVGRKIASVEGFNYSDALSSKEGTWDFDHLFNFLHDPQGWAPGTAMGFAGLDDEQDRANVIAYLNQQGDSPIDLGAGAAGGGEAAQGGEPAAEAEGEQASAEGEGSEQAAAETQSGEETGEENTAEGGSGEQAAAAEKGGEAAAASGDGGDATAEAEGGGHADLIAAADPDAGANVFKKCQACHKLDGTNSVGPHLDGVVGREIASVEDFNYSDALSSKEGIWDFDHLFNFLHDPQGWAPGTAMGFAGLDDEQDRANVIVYLNQQGDAPVDLGGASAAEGAAEGEEAGAEPAEGEEASAEGGSGQDGAVAAASGNAAEEELLETAEDAGKETTAERDAEDKGVPSDSSDVKSVELKDEEEAEAKLEAAAEGGVENTELYSEQQSGTDEVDAEPEPSAGTTEGESAAEGGEAASEGEAAEDKAAEAPEPGSAAPAEPEEVVDEEVETTAEVEANPTTALTEITDEERVEPLPETEETGSEAATGEEEATEEAAGDSGVVALLASADPSAGEQVFRKCSACHRLEEGKNTIGPYLYGVVGRDIASVESYSYSDALASKEGNWDPAALDAFLTDPSGWAPGTKMGFGGLDDPQDRANLIAYLNQASDAPMEFGALLAPDLDGVRLAGLGLAGLGENALEAAAAAEATAERGEAASERSDAVAEVAEGAGALAGEVAEQAADVAEQAAETAEAAAETASAAANGAEDATAATTAAARTAEEAEAVAATAGPAAPATDAPASVPEAAERVTAAIDALTAAMVAFADAARAAGPAANATE